MMLAIPGKGQPECENQILLKKDWADFLLIEHEGLAKTKNLVFFGILFETVKLFLSIDRTSQLV